MPQVPRQDPRIGVAQGGSVGRLRVNAPVEAFGGGAAAQGLANLGKGLQGLGQGIVDAQEGAEHRAQQAAKQQAAIDKAKAERDKKMRDLMGKRIKLNYDQQMQGLANKLKETQTAGTDKTKNDWYNTERGKIQEELLKDVKDPVEREGLLLEMQRSDLARMNSLAESQRSEDTKYENDVIEAEGGNIVSDFRANYDTLNKDTVTNWFEQRASSSAQYAQSLIEKGVPKEKVKQLVEEKRSAGFGEAIKEKIARISASTTPTTAADDIEAIINQVPDSIMDKDAKRDAINDAKTAAKSRVEELDAQAVNAQNTQLDQFASKLANLDNSYEINQEYTQFVKDNPDLRKAAKKIKDDNAIETPTETEIELSKTLSETLNPEKFRDSLLGMLQDGKISTSTYNEYMKLSKKRMDDKKVEVWNSTLNRLEQITQGFEESEAGKGQLRRTGFFASDIKTKKMSDALKTLKDLVYNDNVTFHEVKQIMDDILFDPEQEVMAMKLEKRVFLGRQMLLTAAQRSGTQDISAEDIEIETKSRRKSTEELKETEQRTIDIILNSNLSQIEKDRAATVEATKTAEAQQELEMGL